MNPLLVFIYTLVVAIIVIYVEEKWLFGILSLYTYRKVLFILLMFIYGISIFIIFTIPIAALIHYVLSPLSTWYLNLFYF